MAEISQNVNIEMLEKLPDGTYKRKYPKTRADDGTTFDEHLAESATQAHLGKNIKLQDTANNFTNKDVEGAMNELFTNVSNGKNLVGGAITDVDDSVVIPTDPTFQQLADGIGQISTGKKWASGELDISGGFVEVSGLDFKPSVVMVQRAGTSFAHAVIYNYYHDASKIMHVYTTSSYRDLNLDGGYITFGGFGLTFPVNNASTVWIAFE